MTLPWERILGVPPDLLRLELRRELAEVRERAVLVRSAVYGAPIAHRLTIDCGTLVFDGGTRYGAVIGCQVLGAPAGYRQE